MNNFIKEVLDNLKFCLLSIILIIIVMGGFIPLYLSNCFELFEKYFIIIIIVNIIRISIYLEIIFLIFNKIHRTLKNE